MKLVHLLLWLVLVTVLVECRNHCKNKHEYESYKKCHKKKHQNWSHESQSRVNYEENKERVEKHNKRHREGKTTYSVDLNMMAEESLESMQRYNGHRDKETCSTILPGSTPLSYREMRRQTKLIDQINSMYPDPPKAFDWRNKDGKSYVTPAKNQRHCGDCWVFAAVGVLESQMLIKYPEKWDNINTIPDLSEEQITDCIGTDDNMSSKRGTHWCNGCRGGNSIDAFNYVKDVGFITSEKEYPFDGVNRRKAYDTEKKKEIEVSDDCSFNNQTMDPMTSVKKGYAIHTPDSVTLKKLVANYGPVSVTMRAGGFHQFSKIVKTEEKTGDNNEDADEGSLLYLYRDGIYRQANRRIDHAVLLIGYGKDEPSGEEYWIIKNSYGPGIADNGVFKLSMNQDFDAGIVGPSSSVYWADIV